jgi:hypothetical protein
VNSKKIPEFKTEEEEAQFWDEHDTTEYEDEFKTVKIEVDPELEAEILYKREMKKLVTLNKIKLHAQDHFFFHVF